QWRPSRDLVSSISASRGHNRGCNLTGCPGLRPKNRMPLARAVEMFAQAAAGSGPVFDEQAHLLNRRVRRCRNSLRCDPAVDYVMIPLGDSTGDQRPRKNSAGRLPRQVKMPDVSVGEMPPGNKAEMFGAQTKIAAGVCPATTKCEAQADRKARTRRQWRPTAIVAGVAPAHPRRRPYPTGRPAPAQLVVPKPPPIM